MIKIIGAVCLGKEPRICGVFGQILVLAVSISILCILAVSCSKISLFRKSNQRPTTYLVFSSCLIKIKLLMVVKSVASKSLGKIHGNLKLILLRLREADR